MEEKTRVITPGLVLLKGFLDVETQKTMAEWAVLNGRPELGAKGWYMRDGRTLNCNGRRGRIYRAVETFECVDGLMEMVARAVAVAQEKDAKMPCHEFTHLLLNLYKPADEAMMWHRDSDPNDGDNLHPVVSVSLGDSAYFGYKLQGAKETKILLESGDVLLFGGPQRLIEHCVHNVISGSAPPDIEAILGDTRVNFTCRDAPSIRGKEHLWQNLTDYEEN